MNNQIEKSNEEMKEKHNSLLIQKDLIENEMKNFKFSYENEKNTNLIFMNRVNELEGKHAKLIQKNLLKNQKIKKVYKKT